MAKKLKLLMQKRKNNISKGRHGVLSLQMSNMSIWLTCHIPIRVASQVSPVPIFGSCVGIETSGSKGLRFFNITVITYSY